MDGTLIDSTPGVVGAWEKFQEKYPDIDVKHILSCVFLYIFFSMGFDLIII